MTKFFLAWLTIITLTFPSIMFGALPPTRAAGQSDTLSTTFDFQAPLSQITKTSGTAGLIETGNYNLLKDPGFEGQNLVGWTVGGLSSVTTLNVGLGKQALSFYTTGAAQTFTSDSVTIPPAYYGQNGELTCAVKHAGSAVGGNIGLNASAGTIDQKIELSQASGTYQYFKINFVFPTSGTLNVIGTSGSPYGESFVDDCYLGLARNVAQCGVDTPAVSYTPTGSWTNNTTYSGKWWRRGDRYHYEFQVSLSGAPNSTSLTVARAPGLTIDTSKLVSTTTDGRKLEGKCKIRSAGVTYNGDIYYNGTSNTAVVVQNVASTYPFSSNVTDSLPGAFTNGDVIICEGSVPIVGWEASQCVTPEQQRAPKVTVYTSGSGTFTPSNGATYMHVMVVGGGGGGSGSGSSGAGAGGNGGNSTFGSSLLTASGGTGSDASGSGGAGGGTTVNSPAVTILNVTGGDGGTRLAASTSINFYAPFAYGGANPLGGAGIGRAGSGGNARLNTGGGGAGGRADAGGTNSSGGGGGAGGYIEALISNPSGSYSYAVGTGGSAGSAGTGGHGGGAGAAGRIVVTEYFGYTTAILANSVSTARQSGDRILSGTFNCDASSAVTRTNEPNTTSIGNIASGACAITYAPFSAAPDACTPVIQTCSASNGTGCFARASTAATASGVSVQCYSDTGTLCTSHDFYMICTGPR